MICVTYVGIVAGYLLVGVSVAVILLQQTWRFVNNPKNNVHGLNPNAFHKLCFAANLFCWPIVVYWTLKEWDGDGTSAHEDDMRN